MENNLPTNLTEKDVSIKVNDNISLPGKLTLPYDLSKPVPAVILSAGSGPCDMDESIGPNKPFQDIAWGLAERGIAVLRYDKRPCLLRRNPNLGIAINNTKDEYTDDMLTAINLLCNQSDIDSKKIFILGHSEGAMLIPRFEKITNVPAGYIMLAAPAVKIQDEVLRQVQYLCDIGIIPAADSDAQMAAIKQAYDEINAITEADSQNTSHMVFYAPKSYWADLNVYNQVEQAKSITLPLFILQGETDYQVTMDDFNAWKTALQGKSNVTFKSYPGYNHIFTKTKGEKSTPAEYAEYEAFSPDVISDIADFILK